MKKLYYILLAGVMMFASACQNDIQEEINASTEGKGVFVSIGVTVDNTRFSVEDGIDKPKWTEGDVLTVLGIDNSKKQTLTYNPDNGKFEGTLDVDMVGEMPTMYYNFDAVQFNYTCDAVENKYDTRAIKLISKTGVDWQNLANDEDAKVTMEYSSALLKFSVDTAGDVVFVWDTYYKVKVTDCEVGKTYYVPFNNVYTINNFTYTIGGVEGAHEKGSIKFEAGTIYNLGELSKKPTTIYLVPGQWANDGAWFAVYLYDYTTPELAMTKTEDGYYTCDIPNGVTTFSFWRMNPASTSDITEANRWNEISNVSVPTDENNYYIWANWETGGAWGTKPAENTWGIVGVNGDWDNDINMEKVSAGLYKATNVAMTAYEEWKIRANGAWDLSYASSITGIAANSFVATSTSGNTSVAEDGNYDIYLDIVNDRIYVMTTGTDYTTATEQTSSIAQVTGVPVEDGYIYVKLNSNWASAGWIAAYFCNGTATATWVKAEAVEGVTHCYKVKLPGTATQYKHVIFCRMNSGKDTMAWGNQWDQTSDLTWEGNNLYTIADGAWSYGAGTWTHVETL